MRSPHNLLDFIVVTIAFYHYGLQSIEREVLVKRQQHQLQELHRLPKLHGLYWYVCTCVCSLHNLLELIFSGAALFAFNAQWRSRLIDLLLLLQLRWL